VRPSRSTPSTGRSTSRRDRGRRADVYLLPAVVGGGLGDIEEVLAAGRRLAAAGSPVFLYRRPGRPLPRSVDGPWAWPPLVRTARLRPRNATALTISPAWGISAAPTRPGAFGRGGPWAEEAADIEGAYGVDRTVHVSLEEFARTAPMAREARERFREGGVPSRAIPARMRAAERAGENATFRRAFRRFRAFERPTVLHLFATLRPDRAFAREFPEAVQTGPLWPRAYRGAPRRGAGRRRLREWVWYASPASAETIAPAVVDGLARARPPVRLYIRSPRPWTYRVPDGRGAVDPVARPPAAWRRRFAAAELRIVTGSRSLLEAIEVGGPFLYFNGTLADGPRRRRHRPEKIVAVLAAARAAGVGRAVRRDLADFARGRRVADVVRRAARGGPGWQRLGARLRPRGVAPPYDDAGALLVAVARALARAGGRSPALVARVRGRSSF